MSAQGLKQERATGKSLAWRPGAAHSFSVVSHGQLGTSKFATVSCKVIVGVPRAVQMDGPGSWCFYVNLVCIGSRDCWKNLGCAAQSFQRIF